MPRLIVSRLEKSLVRGRGDLRRQAAAVFVVGGRSGFGGHIIERDYRLRARSAVRPFGSDARGCVGEFLQAGCAKAEFMAPEDLLCVIVRAEPRSSVAMIRKGDREVI